MRIAQVCPFYYPQRGGVETVVKEYSERLVKRGHEVHVYTTDGRWRNQLVDDINGVKVHRSVAFLFSLKLLRADADLIHIHANKHFSTDVGALIAKLKDTPLAYSPHAGTFGKSLLGRVHNQTIGRLALGADVVICVSEHEKSLIKASGVRIKHFEVLPNGVDLSRFLLDVRSHTKQDTSPTVLYIGRLAPHKGLDTLIAAAPLVLKKFPEAKFVIAGPGEISNLGKNALLLGEVSEEEKISLMQKASVFCLPSRSEAFGITVIEAMVAGCPVVVSDLPALTEIVEHNRTGLVFPVDDTKALADRIIKLLSDQGLSQQISKNAREVVREKYDWEKIISRLEKIYQGIL